MTHLGFHYIWDIYHCKYKAIDKVPQVQNQMAELLQISNQTKLSGVFNRFAPHGVTGIDLLRECQLSVHTWSENNYVAIDLFSCVSIDTLATVEQALRKHLCTVRIDFKILERGKV